MQKNCYGYPVELTADAFGESKVLADLLKKACASESPKALIVADMNVVQRTEGLGTKIGRYVQEHGIRLAGSPVVLAGGEKIKTDSLQSALKIVSAMLSAKLGCHDAVLALGGGTLLDVAGYAAAQTRGGVKIVRVPTTPAAMMDAAFADYAAVDSATVKDALRVPSVPSGVVIDTGFAATVLDGVWRGGAGEAIRQAVAADAPLSKKLGKLLEGYGQKDPVAVAELVSAVVKSRMKKGGSSVGQWCALRLESLSGYKLPHGYASAIGLLIDLGYSTAKGYMKPTDRDAVVGLLMSSGALDGLAHSRYLLNQAETLLFGLDAWFLSCPEPKIVVPAGLGKTVADADPDRNLIRQAIAEAVDLSHRD